LAGPAGRYDGMSVDGARRVVLHEDDVGMCHGANAAFVELSRLGSCSSGSVMVPCPWFLEAAEAASEEPQLDLGIHLTLNSEKRHYKWRPLTSPSPSAGLTDAHGFFWPNVWTLRERAHPEAVEAELRAQIEAGYRAGIDITHLDGHMGAALAPEFCDIFIRLGLDYRLPIMMTPTLAAYAPNDNLAGVSEGTYRPWVERARQAGFTLFDRAMQTTWNRTSEPADAAYRRLLGSIPEGLTFVCFHFNAPGELDAIEPGSARIRIEEYELFRDAGFRAFLADQGLEVIGMRPLRDALRARLDERRA
jgi:predicted glycoside hydrolase/deacetylase ChbG (UPF0249 family)